MELRLIRPHGMGQTLDTVRQRLFWLGASVFGGSMPKWKRGNDPVFVDSVI